MTTKPQSTTEPLPPEDMTDDELRAAIDFHSRQVGRFKNEAAKIWRLRLRINNGTPIDQQMLAELQASRVRSASAVPLVDKDLNQPKNAAFEVWWKGQIARDFIHAALTELEKVSGPKLVAGQGSFAVEATAVSAARRSLDSALSTLDGAKSLVVTAAQSQQLQCMKCKHYAETDPRGRCISVYYDAAGSLVYCGCKCEFPAAATAAPQVEQSHEAVNLLNEIDKTARQLLRPNRTPTDIDFAVEYIVSRVTALRRAVAKT